MKQSGQEEVTLFSPGGSPDNLDILEENLIRVVNDIFIEEYDGANIKKICNTRERRRTFDYGAENLGMRTEASGRIFEFLNCFVMAYC